MEIDIKGVAKAHGVTLTTLAERLGVSRQTVHYYIEQGDKNPVAQLEKIAEAIGCDFTDLFKHKKDDFFAVVRCDGEVFAMYSREALKEYADTI